MQFSRSQIHEAARTFVDVPFRHQGRTRAGLDCIGLIWVTAKELGWEFPINNAYSPTPSPNRLIKGIEEVLVKPERQGWDNILPGDVCLFWGWQNEPQHVGFIGELGGYKTMIHAFQRAGKVVEHNAIPFWGQRYVATYCFPGIENLEG